MHSYLVMLLQGDVKDVTMQVPYRDPIEFAAFEQCNFNSLS